MDSNTKPSKYNFLEENLKKKKERQSLDRNPNHQSWERECDVTSDRYQGEYRLDLRSPKKTMTTDEDDDVNTPTTTTETIIIKEKCTYGTGTRVWDCSVLMAKYFEYNFGKIFDFDDEKGENETIDDNYRILELGAGCGLLSISLAKLFSMHNIKKKKNSIKIFATEYSTPIIQHLKENCLNNQVLYNGEDETSGIVSCHKLDWYEKELEGELKDSEMTASSTSSSPFHMVIISDCTLTPSDATALIHVMKRFAVPKVTTFYVGLCKEREGTRLFVELARKEFNVVDEIAGEQIGDDFEYSSKRHFILALRK